MLGLYFLLSLVAFGIICIWLVQNDDLGPGERTTGILRMKDTIPDAAEPRRGARQLPDTRRDSAAKRALVDPLHRTIA